MRGCSNAPLDLDLGAHRSPPQVGEMGGALFKMSYATHTNLSLYGVEHNNITFNNGSLGSRIDEERSEMR